jgi:DNA-binding response OmpR family regulator
VLLVSGANMVEDRVEGLNAGADDFVAKPQERRQERRRSCQIDHRTSSERTAATSNLKTKIRKLEFSKFAQNLSITSRGIAWLLILFFSPGA